MKKTFGESSIAKGENPNGIVSQTADSTVRNADGLGPQQWNWNQEADGPRWNSGFQHKSDLEGVAVAMPRRGRKGK